jgi:hypothetical protein
MTDRVTDPTAPIDHTARQSRDRSSPLDSEAKDRQSSGAAPDAAHHAP